MELMPYEKDDTTNIYWYLFYTNAQALQDLSDYQKKHYGTNLDKPPEPKQIMPKIPVDEEVEELERLMQLPPSAKGHNY